MASNGDLYGGLGYLLGGITSAVGAYFTNRENKKLQEKQWAQSKELANSAHQREVADLRAAGLNPILSANGAGASVPSLGSASLSNPGEGLADGISAASNLMTSQYKANVDNLRANTEQVNTVNSALRADRVVADKERETDLLLADARYDAARRLTGHNDYVKNGIQHTSFDKKAYDEYVDLLKGGMLSEAKMKDNMNWRANLSSFVPFISPAGINSAANAHQTFKYTRRYYK